MAICDWYKFSLLAVRFALQRLRKIHPSHTVSILKQLYYKVFLKSYFIKKPVYKKTSSLSNYFITKTL